MSVNELEGYGLDHIDMPLARVSVYDLDDDQERDELPTDHFELFRGFPNCVPPQLYENTIPGDQDNFDSRVLIGVTDNGELYYQHDDETLSEFVIRMTNEA